MWLAHRTDYSGSPTELTYNIDRVIFEKNKKIPENIATRSFSIFLSVNPKTCHSNKPARKQKLRQSNYEHVQKKEIRYSSYHCQIKRHLETNFQWKIVLVSSYAHHDPKFCHVKAQREKNKA